MTVNNCFWIRKIHFILKKTQKLQTHWLKLKLYVWEISFLILSAKSLLYIVFSAVLFLLSFDLFFSATLLLRKGETSRCLKLQTLYHTSGLREKQLKKKKTTNTFFVRSSNGSMLAKSHQKGIGRKGSYLAVARIIKLKVLKQLKGI